MCVPKRQEERRRKADAQGNEQESKTVVGRAPAAARSARAGLAGLLKGSVGDAASAPLAQRPHADAFHEERFPPVPAVACASQASL